MAGYRILSWINEAITAVKALLDTSALTAERTITLGDRDLDLASGGTFAEANQAKKRIVGAAFDGGGSDITAGTKVYVVCPFAGTLIGWRITATTTGSAIVDVYKISTGSTLPSSSIAASAKPTLSSDDINKDDTLTGWTTSVAADDIFGFNVDSASGVSRLTVQLIINPSA